jgi:hypothetical protein
MTSATSTPVTMAGYRNTLATITRYLAMAGGTLTVVQFALAGLGAFGAVQGHNGKFGAHQVVGNVIGVVSLLVLVAALVARPSARVIGQAIVLFVLSAFQSFLGGLADHHSAWWGALHALIGLGILGLFAQLSRRTEPAARG